MLSVYQLLPTLSHSQNEICVALIVSWCGCASKGSALYQSVSHLVHKKTIPIMIHGDGTPTSGIGKSWGKSADFISWSSMLAFSTFSELVRYLVVAMQAHLRNDKTLNRFFKKLHWSLHWLRLARWLLNLAPSYIHMLT